MIEICYYDCEYCGKRFDNEEECRAHELQEKMNGFASDIKLYDNGYDEVSLTEIITDKKTFDQIFYVTIYSKEAGEALNNYIENELGYPFYNEAGHPHNFPCTIGFWEDNNWLNLTEEQKQLEEVFNHIS